MNHHRKQKIEIEDLKLRSHHDNKHIPIDLTAEILSRLPIKSIGRFMPVPKSWRDVITSRSFSSMHAKNKPFSTFYGTSSNYRSRNRGHVIEVSENRNDVTTLKPKVDESLQGIEISGSCNGLVCLVERVPGFDAITILNPITNEATKTTVPNHDSMVDKDKGEYICNEYYKFGYSPSTGEYKVLKGIWASRGPEMRDRYAILTVRRDERWRDLPPDLFPARMYHETVLCNGAFHWLMNGYEGEDPLDDYILSFDIAQENTRRIRLPRRNHRYRLLLELDNCLCLFRRFGSIFQAKSVWKMVDYGATWRRVRNRFFVSRSFDVLALLWCPIHYGGVPFRLRNNGSLLLCCPKQRRRIWIQCPPILHATLVFDFTPTFSSIDDIIMVNPSRVIDA